MSKEKKAKAEIKKAAWAAKEEKKGANVIGWIIGILIALGLISLIVGAI